MDMAKVEQSTIKKSVLSWPDDPRLGKLIDDNALHVLESISRGILPGKKPSTFSIDMSSPIEWSYTDMLEFMIRVADEYGIEIYDCKTMLCAFNEEYEESVIDHEGNIDPEYEKEWSAYVKKQAEYDEKYPFRSTYNILDHLGEYPLPPRKYSGAYKWALERIAKSKTKEDELLSRLFSEKFDLTDLKQALYISRLYSPSIASDKRPEFMLEEICERVVSQTSFKMLLDAETSKKMGAELNSYLELFIKDKLTSNMGQRTVGGTHVRQSSNIYTFDKHRDLMVEKIKKMMESYGDTFTLEDDFDDLPPFEDGNTENIRARYRERNLLFMHTVFAFEKLGYIEIHRLGTNWEFHEDNPLQYESKIKVLKPLKTFIKEMNAGVLSRDYSNISEPIKIKALGIEINGNHLLKRGQKVKINDTDKRLIYFLYYKYLSNSDECFQIDRLISEPFIDDGKEGGYIKNRIVEINKAVRKTIAGEKGKTSIGSFIKYEDGRGYRLNPNLMNVGNDHKT